MVKIEINRNKAKHITSYKLTGHTGYSKLGEFDIVCSAVSVLAQTAVQGLKVIADIDIKYEIKDGYLSCQLPKELNDKQQLMSIAILETMFVGLKNIEENYRKHIDVRENEEV
ncbi:MAG: ribosomal-processing cysteine protease Prp [Lutisporaceae bacterium]